ncbi:F-box/LRR-repeat protein 7 isoform X1 [Musca domestica]|uniref:F-box/LRR-repeat protein 7 isoform X1 n=2 Tax=Musca domestica TaxID=7370 RepID=A0A1I8N6K2_MUSDO|nr:F-box/LRR-repeat protein 7 isoform X1 [Musca domestica]
MDIRKPKTNRLFKDPIKQLKNMHTLRDLAKSLEASQDVGEKSSMCLRWNDLPNELLIHIFQYLPHGDLQQVRLVCRRWHDLAQLPEFKEKNKIVVNNENKFLLLESLNVDSDLAQRLSFDTLELHGLELADDVQLLLKYLGKKVRKLRLYKSPVFASLNDNLPALEELIVTHIPTVQSDNTFSLNLSNFPKFKALDIACSNVTTYVKTHMILNLTREVSVKMGKLCIEVNRDHEDLLIYTLQCHAQTLRHLEIILRSTPIMIVKWKQVFAALENLETLKITGVSCYMWLKHVFECLPKEAPLRHLDLSGGLQVDDPLLKLIVNKWPQSLETMELMFCSCLTDEGVKSLGSLRGSLKTLNISHCSKISSQGLLQGLVQETNPILTTLVLNDITDTATDNMCLVMQRLPNLCYLSLESCRDAVTDVTLENIFRHQTKLQHLFLDDCMRISDEGLLGFGSHPAPIHRLKGLQTLSLRGCRNLSNRALAKGLKFPELRKLVLGYCHKISSMGIEELVENCPSLEDLTISSCLMIDDDAMLHIAQGLPRLRRLNVSNCINLTGKSIDYVVELCRSLKELSMCGIDSLEIQEVQDKFLQMKPQICEVNL